MAKFYLVYIRVVLAFTLVHCALVHGQDPAVLSPSPATVPATAGSTTATTPAPAPVPDLPPSVPGMAPTTSLTNNSLTQANLGQILTGAAPSSPSSNLGSSNTPLSDPFGLGSFGSSGNGTSGGNVSSGTMVFGPAGRLVVLEPALKFNFVLRFRIGENITFAWKYDDNVRIKPINISLEVAGSDRNFLPLAINMSGSTTKFVWETAKWDPVKGPLTEYQNYQMIVYDERGRDALPEAGRLASYRGTRFGLTFSGDVFCAACSAGHSLSTGLYGILIVPAIWGLMYAGFLLGLLA